MKQAMTIRKNIKTLYTLWFKKDPDIRQDDNADDNADDDK
jgi:hypothetical protein